MPAPIPAGFLPVRRRHKRSQVITLAALIVVVSSGLVLHLLHFAR
jgi:hypothetical protein